jgi:hypothetical protein
MELSAWPGPGAMVAKVLKFTSPLMIKDSMYKVMGTTMITANSKRFFNMAV